MSSAKEDPSVRLWYALDVDIESPAREAVEYGLMEAGALGTETKDSQDQHLRVSGYFAQVPGRELVGAELVEALRLYALPSSSISEMNIREVADQDWLGEWKKSWQPIEVGERFIIAPPWNGIGSEMANAGERIVIRIEPGMAFGTGTHETTRLCLAAIEKYFEGGSFLDVGTGTGILAIAAAKLFPDARVEACDTDPEALGIARENAQLNRVGGIAFDVGTISKSTRASANCVCANLTAETIVSLAASLIGVTCGRLILSGILESQIETVMTRLRELDVSEPAEVASAGEWACIVV